MSIQSFKRSRPYIAITLGDPAGIGPEIVAKSLADFVDEEAGFAPIVIGDKSVFVRTLRETGIADDYSYVEQEAFENSSLEIAGKSFIDLGNCREEIGYGVESAEAGRAAGQFIEFAVDLCKRGVVDAVATAPINKSSFNMGGFDFPGHTEFLAHLTSTESFEMSFFAERLRVVLLSRHLSLRNALEVVTTENVLELIRFTDRAMERLLKIKPSIAVPGLNPHSSEGGMFGNEEARAISPAIEKARAEGIDVSGPYSPDTIFLRGFNGEFDCVLALYHDQATIPVKCLTFGKGVNVTLGLPIVRTSVDHGTAFEIAGQDKADCGSMKSAIELAAELAGLHK